MTIWLQLIAQVGIPLAYQLWKTWSNKTEPTEADWQALLTLSQKTTAQYVAEAQAAVAVPEPPAPVPAAVVSVPATPTP